MRAELPLDLLQSVSPRDARAYAKAKGWQRVERAKGSYAVFRLPENDLDQVLIPSNSETDDFVTRIKELVWKFAEVERRSAPQVLTDILNHDADVLRVRISGEHVERGGLALGDAVTVFEGVRRSILAAAHSVLKPQKYHPRLGRREAEQLVQSCRFEQTERGSFVVAVSCPIRAVDTHQQNTSGTNDSFTRATTRHLAKSLALLSEGIVRDTIAQVLQDQSDRPTISANLCDALLRLRPQSHEAAVEYSISWAPSFPFDGTEAASTPVRFETDDFDTIEDAYLQLRPATAPELDVFVAMVDELRGALNDNEQREGDVTLSLYSRESEEIVKARAELPPDCYRIADRAHMSGGYVMLRGSLRRGRRVSRVTNITMFRPVDADGPQQTQPENPPSA